jgi:hypothetical protein
MIGYEARFCDYCHLSIQVGQRWVREKIYDPYSRNQVPVYRYFHVEPFDAQEPSCWEKRQLEREITRTATRESTGHLRGLKLVA